MSSRPVFCEPGSRGRLLLAILFGVLAGPAPAGAQAPLVELMVEGNSRFSQERVAAASGLKRGAVVTRPDLDAAAARLLETGLFRSVNYNYQPRPGGAGAVVTLRVEEERATVPVQLDLAGVDEAKLWELLQSTGGLIEKTMPGTGAAAVYYQRAIESALGASSTLVPITMKTEVADLGSGNVVAIFHPANLPKVSEIRFEGNRNVSTPALVAAVSRLVVGRDYSERDLRRILELNAKPLYEEQGLLTIAFPTVRASTAGEGTVAVTASVEEGPRWTLAKVEVVGEGLPLAEMRSAAKFPEGKAANWKLVTAGVASLEDVLKRDGYLGIESVAQRDYRADAGLVNVTVRVNKGKQFRFGALRLEGLGPAIEKRARALWKLREGDPMNAPYVDDFLRSVLQGPAVGAKSVASELRVRLGSDTVDVLITFK